MDRIGVLHVVHSLNVGGAEKLVFDLARRTDSSRFAVSVACLDAAGSLAPALAAQGIPVTVLERKPGIDRRLPLRIARLARRLGAHVLHTHQYTPYFYGVLGGRLAGCRVLFTEHGRHFPDVRKPRRALANALLVRGTQAVVAVSGFTRQALISNDGFPGDRVQVLYNGVEVEGREPLPAPSDVRASLGVPSDVPLLGLCARLSPEKNIPLLLEALSRVRQVLPETRLFIAGDGPARPEIEAACTRLGLGDAVQLLGFRNDVPALLSAADVFTLPSLTEGTSVTLLEAMLAGKPSVATRVGGNPEILVDGVTGTLVDSGDVAAFSRAILEVLQSPALAATYGTAAAARVRERFTFEEMVRGYEALYVG